MSKTFDNILEAAYFLSFCTLPITLWSELRKQAVSDYDKVIIGNFQTLWHKEKELKEDNSECEILVGRRIELYA